MNKSKILEISKEDFKLEYFINEIAGNLEEVIEPEYVCIKMRSSMIEENVYVEEEDSEENIWYLRFFIDKGMWGDEGYVCGDGSRFDEDEVDYGGFVNYDNGFIILEENNMLSIHKATYGPANPFQDVVRLVDNGGSFDELMQNFIKRFA